MQTEVTITYPWVVTNTLFDWTDYYNAYRYESVPLKVVMDNIYEDEDLTEKTRNKYREFILQQGITYFIYDW